MLWGLDATDWAAIWATVALFIFLIIAVAIGTPRIIAKMLDERIARIRADVDDAKRLRSEAEALLAEYEQKRQSAEAEAADIVSAAQEEAKRMTEQAAASLKDLVARRTRTVEDKIAQAEAAALAEVRARSADVAVEAARLVLTRQMDNKGDELVEHAIRDVGARLN